MHVFNNRNDFDFATRGVTKWMRTGQALDVVETLQNGVAYSIGDSLTYLKTTAQELSSELFEGTRRYVTVLAALEGEVNVGVAHKAELQVADLYSDITDRQHFKLPPRAADHKDNFSVVIPQGGILVTEIDEAVKVQPIPNSTVVLLHVTVEGATFSNK